VRNRYIAMGYHCTKEKPNKEGYDFYASKEIGNREVDDLYIEVKAGPHGLSKAQERFKGK